MAGELRAPSHSSSSIPLFRPSSGAKMGKVACLRYQVSHPCFSLPSVYLWGLGTVCLSALQLLLTFPVFRSSISARESESLIWTWAQNIQDVNLPILVKKWSHCKHSSWIIKTIKFRDPRAWHNIFLLHTRTLIQRPWVTYTKLICGRAKSHT